MIAARHTIAEENAISEVPPIPAAFTASPTKNRFLTVGINTLGLHERVISGVGVGGAGRIVSPRVGTPLT